MKTIKLKNGKARVEIKDNVFLSVYKSNNLYDLTMQRPTEKGRGTIFHTICEDKKRISTINKYAKKYEIQFEEEI